MQVFERRLNVLRIWIREFMMIVFKMGFVRYRDFSELNFVFLFVFLDQ